MTRMSLYIDESFVFLIKMVKSQKAIRFYSDSEDLLFWLILTVDK